MGEDDDFPEDIENAFAEANGLTATGVRSSKLFPDVNTTEGFAAIAEMIIAHEDSRLKRESSVDVDCRSDKVVDVSKVAHVPGDKGDAAWVKTLAELTRLTDWGDTARADAMLAALLRLPPLLLHRVLTDDRPYGLAADALDKLPPPLHAAVIAAAASSGTLKTRNRHAHAVLMHLAAACVPDPDLRVLELGQVDHRGFALEDADGDGHSDMHAHADPSPGALLALAVSAHPSLTALTVTAPRLRPHWLRDFGTYVAPPALPCLVNLRIAIDAHPGGCVELAAALALLPTLTTLSITITTNRWVPSDEVTFHRLACLAATPAILPSVQTLNLTERAPGSGDPPHARSADGARASVAHLLLLLLSAPALTSLDFKPSDLAEVSVRGQLAGVTRARFPALRRLTFNGPLPPSNRFGAGDVEGTACAADSMPPPLQELSVWCACVHSALSIASVGAQLSAGTLTHLSVDVCEENSECGGNAGSGEAVWRAWASFTHALASCRQLRRLDLSCLFGVSFENCGVFSGALADALPELTELTHFSMAGGSDSATGVSGTWFDGRALGRGVAGLVALEWLFISDGQGEVVFSDHGEALLEASAGLKRLSHLTLLCWMRNGVRALSAAVPKLRVLKKLCLSDNVFPDGPNSRKWRAFVARFPHLELELL